MKPTSDDAKPRKDGWFEHQGIWDEVVVGTVLASRDRPTTRWEVIDTRHPPQVKYGYTMWFKLREQTTGEEFALEPQGRPYPVTILTQNPRDKKCGEPTEPSDTQAILRIIEDLGAELLASRDEETGQIVCPNYVYESHIPGVGGGKKRLGLIEHLRVAHGEQVVDDVDYTALSDLHARCHQPHRKEGKGGFPHRHARENLELF